jgi:4-amino-4-deoxychorismate lyase
MNRKFSLMGHGSKRQSQAVTETVSFTPWFGVFETLRVMEGVPLFVAEHRAELARAMEALGLKSDFDFEKARAELPSRSGRWRWIVTSEGTRTLFSEEAEPATESVELSLSPVRVGSQNWDARFKTLSYLAHVQAWQTGTTPEVVLLNEHGQVASGSRSNIFWRCRDRFFTPAHEAGCRCGVVRDFILKNAQAETGHYGLEELLGADEIFLTNSMKGIISASAFDRRSLSSSSADELRSRYVASVRMQLPN